MNFGDDFEARKVLSANFTETAGVFRKKDPAYQPTEEEWAVIGYLFLEWDYAYEDEPKADGT